MGGGGGVGRGEGGGGVVVVVVNEGGDLKQAQGPRRSLCGGGRMGGAGERVGGKGEVVAVLRIYYYYTIRRTHEFAACLPNLALRVVRPWFLPGMHVS